LRSETPGDKRPTNRPAPVAPDEVRPEFLAACPAADCKNLVFAHWRLLEALARKRFKDSSLADQALLFVQAGLEAKDWRRVRAYQGKASFKTYLAQVAASLVSDYGRTLYKRQRPPVWIKVRGFLYERLFKLLCRERLAPENATRALAQGGADAAPGGADPETVAAAIEEILRRLPECGQNSAPQFIEFKTIDELASKEPEAHQRTPEDAHAAPQRDAFLDALRRTLDLHEELLYAPAPELADRLFHALRADLVLSSEERAFLGLIYRDGLAVKAAARRLGAPEGQAHSTLKKLLAKIRAGIETATAQYGGLDGLGQHFFKNV